MEAVPDAPITLVSIEGGLSKAGRSPDARLAGPVGADGEQIQAIEQIQAADRMAKVTDLRALMGKVEPVSGAHERVLPVPECMETIFEGGLRRGTSVVVRGESGATSLALALCAGVTRGGLWVGCLNVGSANTGPSNAGSSGRGLSSRGLSNTGSLGWATAQEMGADLHRVVSVEVPEDDISTAAAVMVDVFDMVLCDSPRGVSASSARRLAARARERGCVMVILGDRLDRLCSRGFEVDDMAFWPEATDAVLDVEDVSWGGLGRGEGRLRQHRIRVGISGRRGMAMRRSTEIRLPEVG